MTVDTAQRQAGFGCDVANRGGGKALTFENSASCFKKIVATEFALGGLGAPNLGRRIIRARRSRAPCRSRCGESGVSDL